MARHPRVVRPNVAMHIVQRGNNRMECFRADSDRLVYLAMLRELSALTHCAVHAYCLMTNHVHLLLTPESEAGPSLLMRDLARCYAAYFNRRYRRSGGLWESRFRSCLVESSNYVLACYRYIEMNPVRAGIVAAPDGYPWSSHRANVGSAPDAFLSCHPEFAVLTPAAYLRLFEAGDDPQFLRTVRESTAGGYPLVSEVMKAELRRLGTRTEPGKRGPRATAVLT